MIARGFQLIVSASLSALLVAILAIGSAMAQEPGPFGGFKHDSSSPIEIAADSLEVQQKMNTATFNGAVVAGQGTLRMTTDKLTVTYGAGNNATDTGAIQSMRADGNVFLSNDAETAQGAWAVYDVASGMIRMGGNVILTQGENAISGESLVIDLNEGNGRIEGGRVKSVFKPAAQPSADPAPAATEN